MVSISLTPPIRGRRPRIYGFLASCAVPSPSVSCIVRAYIILGFNNVFFNSSVLRDTWSAVLLARKYCVLFSDVRFHDKKASTWYLKFASSAVSCFLRDDAILEEQALFVEQYCVPSEILPKLDRCRLWQFQPFSNHLQKQRRLLGNQNLIQDTRQYPSSHPQDQYDDQSWTKLKYLFQADISLVSYQKLSEHARKITSTAFRQEKSLSDPPIFRQDALFPMIHFAWNSCASWLEEWTFTECFSPRARSAGCSARLCPVHKLAALRKPKWLEWPSPFRFVR